MQLKREQFDNSVRIGVKGVLNQLTRMENNTYLPKTEKRPPNTILPTSLLDSLFYEDLECMNLDIGKNYYGIYNRYDSTFVAGHFQHYQKQLIRSEFQFSLSAIYQQGDYYLSLYFPTKERLLFSRMEIWLLVSVLFLFIIVASFIFTISTLMKQKKISEMKNEFINNLTHEFKTPLATSSLAAEIMLRPDVNQNPDKIEKYAAVILDENIRLKNMVDQVLQMARLEKGYQRFKMEKEDIHELLRSVIDSFEIRIQETNGKLDFIPEAKRQLIKIDARHMVNVFYNLLDNAIKYSDKPPRIKISTRNNKNGLFICFEDHGKGISSEYQQEIFKNFYRVPTGNIQDSRGFGLGLYYVKKVMEAHSGHITVKSNPGKGSVFELFIPFREGIGL